MFTAYRPNPCPLRVPPPPADARQEPRQALRARAARALRENRAQPLARHPRVVPRPNTNSLIEAMNPFVQAAKARAQEYRTTHTPGPSSPSSSRPSDTLVADHTIRAAAPPRQMARRFVQRAFDRRAVSSLRRLARHGDDGAALHFRRLLELVREARPLVLSSSQCAPRDRSATPTPGSTPS